MISMRLRDNGLGAEVLGNLTLELTIKYQVWPGSGGWCTL